jgi:hypothetical protein
MGVEEKARFTAQIEAITRLLIDIGERHSELQKLSIGNSDPTKAAVSWEEDIWEGGCPRANGARN